MTITQSTSAPLVVIGGATGNQGGSVLRYLQESDKEYRLRGLTRDNTRPKAKALANLGVDVVSVDLKPENEAKIVEAYSGADVVFAVTNFWEHMDVQREINEGKAMIDAGVAAGVKLFICSSLPSYIDISHGKVSRVHHFESKALVEEYGRSKASDKFQFVTSKQKQPDGTWLWKSPISADPVLPSIDIDEFGLWVRAVIEHKELRDDGRAIPAVGEDISYRKMIDAIHKATGADIKIIDDITIEEARNSLPEGTPAHIVDDLGEDGYYAQSQFGYFKGVDVKWPLKYLAKKPSTFEEWLGRADLSEYKN